MPLLNLLEQLEAAGIHPYMTGGVMEAVTEPGRAPLPEALMAQASANKEQLAKEMLARQLWSFVGSQEWMRGVRARIQRMLPAPHAWEQRFKWLQERAPERVRALQEAEGKHSLVLLAFTRYLATEEELREETERLVAAWKELVP